MNKIVLAIGIGLLLFSNKIFGKSEPSSSGSGSGSNYIDSQGNYIGPVISYQGGPLSDTYLRNSFNAVKSGGSYSTQYMNDIERLFRLETAHFKSGQFVNSYTPGMVAFANSFPYGWNSLQTWANLRNLGPGQFGVTQTYNTSAGPLKYITFPSFLYALDFTSWFLKNVRGGDTAKWFSTDTSSAGYQNYKNALKNVQLRYTV
jgi:hypothetical protein